MTVKEQVANLVHQNGLLPVIRALANICDEDSIAIPNNLGATFIAYRLEEVVRMCEGLLKGDQDGS